MATVGHIHRFTIKRDSLVGAAALSLVSILDNLAGMSSKGASLLSELVVTFVLVFALWNGNFYINCRLEQLYDWHNHARKRIITNLLLTLLFTVSATWIASYFYLVVYLGLQNQANPVFINVLVCTLVTLLINTIYLSIGFFHEWKKSLVEKEELKREGISAEFETLKNQINPHFLFNSLNTLTSLIEENPHKATDFVQKMSSVYRYVLSQKDKETVTLGEELEFIHAYLYLNRMRFGDNLQAEISIDKKYYERRMATLTLQMLVENCIKHNVISAQHPLHIFIGTDGHYVEVRNNLQPKQTMNESNGIGLSNIMHRYRFLNEKEVEVTNNEKEFIVRVPLL